MASYKNSTTVIPPSLILRGDLKVAGNIEFATDFKGSVKAGGEVHVLPGIRLESDVICESLRIDPGASLKGSLQVGEARKPLSRFWNWVKRLGIEKRGSVEKFA